MATLRKLAGGDWGITGTQQEIIQGNRVRVERRDGSIQFKIVGEVLGWEGQLLVARYYDVTGNGSPPNGNHHQPTQHSNHAPVNGSVHYPVQVSGQPTSVQPVSTGGHLNGSASHSGANVVATPPQQAAMPPVTPQTQQTASTVPSVPQSQSVYEPGPIAPPKPAIEGNPLPEITPEDMELAVSRLGELVVIDYDVPDTFPNPSAIMYASGFYRSSESCWVGSKSRIPWRLLHRMMEHGCIWDMTDLPAHETARKVNKAILVITKEIRKLQASIQGSIETAQKNLEEASEENEDGTKSATLKIQEKHKKAVEAAIKRNQKKLDEFMVAARAFGIDQVLMTERRKMGGIVSGMKKIAERKVEAWLNMVEKAKDTSFAKDIESGEMPVGVALDYLTDEGIDVEDERDNM